MKTELKELKKKRKAAALGLEDRERELEGLAAKLERGIDPALSGAVSSAQAAKEEAVRLYALGKVDQGKVEQARRDLERAQRAESEAAEVYRAVEEVHEETRRELDTLRRTFRDCDRDAWRAVKSILREEIRNDAAFFRKVHRAFVAESAALGFNVPFEGFCGDLFKDNELQGSRELAEELEREYLK